MMNTEIYICISRTDGSVAHMAFQLVGRFPRQPNQYWQPLENGQWQREPTDPAINHEVMRLDAYWTEIGDPGLVGWRRLSQTEHEMFNQNRTHRDALEDVGGKIKHNMVKARELHRAFLRHYNGDKLMGLDREWVNASAAKDNARIKIVEDKRKALNDSVNDPRIEAAQTIEELLAVTPVQV